MHDQPELTLVTREAPIPNKTNIEVMRKIAWQGKFVRIAPAGLPGDTQTITILDEFEIKPVNPHANQNTSSIRQRSYFFDNKMVDI